MHLSWVSAWSSSRETHVDPKSVRAQGDGRKILTAACPLLARWRSRVHQFNSVILRRPSQRAMYNSSDQNLWRICSRTWKSPPSAALRSAVFIQPVSWPTFHGNMTDSSCLCDNISNSVCGNDEPGPVTHAARFMVLPWLYSRSGFSSLAATGFEFWSCGWVAEWQADKWLTGSWEDMTAGLLFWNNKACYCNSMNSVFGNGGKTALLISNDQQCKSHTF